MSSPDPTTLVSELLTETKNKAVADVIEAERNRRAMIDKKYQLKEVIIYVKRNSANKIFTNNASLRARGKRHGRRTEPP